MFCAETQFHRIVKIKIFNHQVNTNKGKINGQMVKVEMGKVEMIKWSNGQSRNDQMVKLLEVVDRVFNRLQQSG